MVDAEQTRRDHDEAHRYAAGYLVSPRERKVGRALRFATDPFEEESLSGLLARATAFHVLLHTNGVLRRAGINMKTAGQLALLPPERLKPLAGIIGCTLDDITARSFTRTHSDRKVSDVTIGDATIRMFDLETTRRRIAPGTLRTHPFHRMAWMMRRLPYCEVSHELLRSDCSECARPLRWKDSCGVGVCESCEAEVRPSAEPPLTEGDRENYSIFADLLSANPRRHRDTLSRLSPPLRNLDHNTLVEMVLGVGARVVAAERPKKEINRKAIHRLPPEYLGAVIARGIGMMRNWPDDLRTWARERAETLRNDRHAFLTHRAELRLLGARSRVSPAQATVMREALGDLFAKEHRSFAAPQTTALRFEASAILGTTNEALAELAALGHLSEGSIPGRSRDHVRYSMVELNEIRRALTESRTWPEIARSIGIPLYGMEQLCCTEKLDREMNAAAQYLRGAWGITTASRDTLWSDIRRNATEGIRLHGATPLGTAVRRIGGRLKPWGAIFDALSGSASQPSPFRFWISAENTTAWTRRIQVCPHDLKRFDDVAFESEDYATLDFSKTTNITGAREILNLAGIPNCDLRKLFADDIASRPQFGPEKAVGLGVVLEEAKRSISVAEICERNRWSPRRLKGQVLRFASARTATGWKRDVIEGSGLLVS